MLDDDRFAPIDDADGFEVDHATRARRYRAARDLERAVGGGAFVDLSNLVELDAEPLG